MLVFRTFLIAFLFAQQISCKHDIDAAKQVDDKLFISLPATDSVLIVNPNKQVETARLKIGKLPHNIRKSADGTRLYIALTGSQAIAEIDVINDQVIRTFLTDPVPMQDADGNEIQAHIDQQANTFKSCYECHNGRVEGAKPAIVGSRPFGIALTSNNQLLVANTQTASVNYIDLETAHIIKSLQILPSGDAREPTELAIMGDRLFVTVRPVLPSSSPAELRAYDIESGALLAQTNVGSAVTALHTDLKNNVIYTTNFESNTLEKFGADLQILKQYIVGNGPFGLNQNRAHLLVANYYNNSVSKIELTNNNIYTQSLQFETQHFANPTHITRSFDEEKLYVISGGTNGYLLTLEATTLSVTNSMKIDGLPFDVINTNTHPDQG